MIKHLFISIFIVSMILFCNCKQPYYLQFYAGELKSTECEKSYWHTIIKTEKLFIGENMFIAPFCQGLVKQKYWLYLTKKFDSLRYVEVCYLAAVKFEDATDLSNVYKRMIFCNH